MFEYVVTNTREETVTVDGLDVFPPGATKQFTSEAGENFAMTRGLPLNQDNVPAGVVVTIEVK